MRTWRTRAPIRTTQLLLIAVVMTPTAVGCNADPNGNGNGNYGDDQGGVVALWVVAPGQKLSPATTSFTARVVRLECSGGVTGRILPPEVEFHDAEVVITFEAARRDVEGGSTCQGNPWVPYEVELDQRLGDRVLVDGQCLSGNAATTADCHSPPPTRWPLPEDNR